MSSSVLLIGSHPASICAVLIEQGRWPVRVRDAADALRRLKAGTLPRLILVVVSAEVTETELLSLFQLADCPVLIQPASITVAAAVGWAL